VTRPDERRARVYIGLGSNLDHPLRQIRRALDALACLPTSALSTVSSWYRSRPMGDLPQPEYVNAVAALDTALSPLALLDALQAIEARQGRVRTAERWAARSIDLDLLLYGEYCVQSARLVLPHPGLCEREFVLYPLYEIAPELSIPGHGNLQDCLSRCPLRGLQRLPAELEEAREPS